MINDVILSFFRDDIGGIMITDGEKNILFTDHKMSFIRNEKTNWKIACPAPQPGQHAVPWDLVHSDSKKTYMVISSTFEQEGKLIQVHHLVDTSLYMELYREITEYSKTLQDDRDHDAMTGLYNKGKFMELKQSLFQKQETIAVFSMDLNNLKLTNDTLGHQEGDNLIIKAAESLKSVSARNVIPFRVGGDEFLIIAIHVDRQKAEKIKEAWESNLAGLNKQDDSIHCVMACGFVFAEKGYDLDEVLARADQLMYEDKQRKKMKK